MKHSTGGGMEDREQDREYLRQAVQLAASHLQAGEGGPFGALVVRGEEIVGQGWNRVVALNDPTAHAEIVALRNAAGKLSAFHLAGCTLYSSCEPCPMCLAAAYWARVERIVFAACREQAAAAGFADARIYREMALPLSGRSLRMVQIALPEAEEMMTAWVRMEGKVRY